jgi:hypothetical protein
MRSNKTNVETVDGIKQETHGINDCEPVSTIGGTLPSLGTSVQMKYTLATVELTCSRKMCHCFTLIVFLRGVYNECLWCAGIPIPTSLDGWSCRPISILLLSSTTYCYYYYYYTNCFSNSLFKSTSCRMKYISVECAPSNENRKFSSRFSDKLPFTMYHHVHADCHYAL